MLKRTGKTIDSLVAQSQYCARILRLAQEGTINHPIVRALLQKMIIDGADPAVLLAQDEWIKISDETRLRTLVQEMIAKYPKESELLKTGSMKYLEILCGLVMKRTKGFADQQLVKQLIKEE